MAPLLHVLVPFVERSYLDGGSEHGDRAVQAGPNLPRVKHIVCPRIPAEGELNVLQATGHRRGRLAQGPAMYARMYVCTYV